MKKSVVESTLALFGLDPSSVRAGFVSNDEFNIDHVNVLTQPRQTFNNGEELAENIQMLGQIEPVIIAQMDIELCREYLEVVNSVWGANHQISDLKYSVPGDGSRRYSVLIAGERRYRAIRKNGGKRIAARVWLKPIPVIAVCLQFSENIHEPVPVHQEAQGYRNLFSFFQRGGVRVPKKSFAKLMGRTSSWMLKAIRFCSLPDEVRKEVEEGHISYGIAIELARMAETGSDDKEIIRLLGHFVTNGTRVEDAHKLVSRYIREKKSGQTGFFESDDTTAARQSKAVVQRKLVLFLREQIRYFKAVLNLFRKGLLTGEDAKYSLGSPVREYKTLVDLMEELLPHVRDYMESGDHEKAEQILEEYSELLKDVEPAD